MKRNTIERQAKGATPVHPRQIFLGANLRPGFSVLGLFLLLFSFFGPCRLEAQSDSTRSLSVAVDSISLPEADGTRRTADFTITLSETKSYSIYVSYHTVDGSANAGEDYNFLNGTVEIPAGETSAVVGVSVIDDTVDEPTESFSLTASIAMKNSDTSPSTAQGDCSILDNDADTNVVLNEATADPTPGQDVEYDIIVQNNGHHTISGAQIMDAAPATLTNLRWNCLPSPGSSCAMGFHQGPLSDLPELPPGGAVSYVLLGTIEPHATGALDYSVHYDISPTGYEPTNPENDSAASTLTVQPKTDFGLNITDSADPVPEDGHFSYTLAVTNHGPSASTGGRIVNQLPPELHFESSEDGCYVTMDGIVCPFHALDPGASSALSFSVSGTEQPGLLVEETATVQSNETDPNPDNNVQTEETSLDCTPPSVIGVFSDPGWAAVDSCHSIRDRVLDIGIEFSEALKDLPGNDEPGDADNPDSYLLLYSGANQNFETSGCTAPAGDDIQLPIAGVKIRTNQVIITPADAPLQTEGLYRLIACASLEDPARNALDGDDDGQGGDDYQLSFRYSPAETLFNQHFDCSLENWDTTSTIPEELEYSTDDSLGSELSGSVHLQTINSVPGESLGLSQCLPVEEGNTLSTSALFKLDAPSDLQVSFVCSFYPQSDCSAEILRSDSSDQNLSDSGGNWVQSTGFSSLPAPPATLSARCGFYLSSPAGDDFNAWIDEVDAQVELSSFIFGDGFETGTTENWSGEIYE